MTIAQQIIAGRKALGLSQTQLAAKANVSQQLVSQLERGENLTTKHLPRIARALALSLADLDPSYADTRPAERSEFSEGDAAIWVAAPASEKPGTPNQREAMFISLTPGVKSRQIYTMSKSLHALGILAGDVAIAEAQYQAGPGDLVIANLHDPQTASSRLLVRRYFPPFLVSATSDESDQAVTTEAANIVAKIVAVLRLPLEFLG